MTQCQERRIFELISRAFLNLTEEKRQTITEVAFLEFSTKNYEDVSFFQIAKLCNISRASMYVYFESKAKLYHFLLNQVFFDVKEKIRQNFVQDKIEKPNFEVPQTFFENALNCYGTKNHQFVHMFLKNLNSQNCKEFFEEKPQNAEHKYFLQHKIPIMLVITSVVFVLLEFYENKISKQQAMQDFELCKNIIIKGIKNV